MREANLKWIFECYCERREQYTEQGRSRKLRPCSLHGKRNMLKSQVECEWRLQAALRTAAQNEIGGKRWSC